MDFLSQYESLELIAEGETKTFRARTEGTRRPVLLHQLSSNPRSSRQVHLLTLVLRYTSSLHPGSASPILGVEEHGDSVWVVTEDLPEIGNLWTWLENQTAKKDEAAPPPVPPVTRPIVPGVTRPLVIPSTEASRPASALDEKTLLFATRLAAADSSPVVDLDARPAQQGQPNPVTDRTEQTARFSSLQASPPPGEVTRFFSSPPGSETETLPRFPSAPAPPAEPGGDEVTSTLRIPMTAPAEPSGAADRTQMAQAPPARSGPGEFTLVFKTPAPSSAARSSGLPGEEGASSVSDPASEPTVVLRRPPQGDAPAGRFPRAVPSTPAEPVGGPADASEAPGEFTMLFRRTPGGDAPGEQKARFMGFTAPTQEKAKFIETAPVPAPPAREPSPPAPQTPALSHPIPPGESTAAFGVPPAVALRDQGLPNFPGPDDPLSPMAPGEFTQVFQRDEASRSEQQEPGAFTRIFQIPVGSDLLTAMESKTVASAPPPAWQAEMPPVPPAGQVPPVPLASAPAAQAGGSPLTPSIPKLEVGSKPLAAPPPALKPPVPPIPKFEPPKAPPLAAPKPPAVAVPKIPKLPEAAASAPGPSILPLILIFGGIVLVAVLLVLFFVTRH